MTDSIFLIGEDGAMRPLSRSGFLAEDVLQNLLATHPELLVGDQIDLADPRRWILITREAGIPGESDGGNRWSVDHLFLDQDAIPTLVEVKRSQDTRLRREVVGQLLEYAANAVSYWSPAFMRQRFEHSCRLAQVEPADRVRDLLGPEGSYEDFWEQAKTNLQAGRVRLLFVADVIPTELRQIVEFLNDQMDPAQVLAIEVKQYRDDSIRTLVPSVVGQSAAAQARKGSARQKKKWDEAAFMQAIAANRDASPRVARQILEWARARDLDVWWGEGTTMGSFVPVDASGEVRHQPFAVWTTGQIELYSYWWNQKAPFDSEEAQLEMFARLNQIPGIELGPEHLRKRPSVPLSVLESEAEWQQFVETFDWYLERVRRAG